MKQLIQFTKYPECHFLHFLGVIWEMAGLGRWQKMRKGGIDRTRLLKGRDQR